MLYKFTTKDNQTVYGDVPFQYKLGEWVVAPGNSEPDGLDCGPNRLHLMKGVNPKYAPLHYICHEAEGEGLMGESAEKASYQRVRLLRTLTDVEVDNGIDRDVWERNLGKAGLWLPISDFRKATFLDRPAPNREWLEEQLKPLHSLLDRRWVGVVCCDIMIGDSLEASLWDSLEASLWDSLEASLWDSLRASLWNSLRDSLWDSLEASLRTSLFYERGFVLAGNPRPELVALLNVWRSGVCPLGWNTKGQLVVLVKEINS